jgi:hypothetical protein
MYDTDRVIRWNRWYDGLPGDWRFQFVLWPVLAIGALNMLLTVSIGFPFGLLLLVCIAFVASVRVPYALGYLTNRDLSVPAPWWVRPFI